MLFLIIRGNMNNQIESFVEYSFKYNDVVKKLDNFYMKGNHLYLSKENKITSKHVEKQIAKFSFTQDYSDVKTIDEKCETRMKLPTFIYPLYYFIFFHDRLPSPNEFINLYMTTYFDINDGTCTLKTGKTNVHINAITSRLYRSYPSFIRDFHFYLLCKESNLFDSVVYSAKEDFSGGMDIEVTKNGIKYPVSLMLDSPRSNYFKSLKYGRRNVPLKNEIIIKISLNKKTEKMAGEIFLYSEKHVKYLVEQINNGSSSYESILVT